MPANYLNNKKFEEAIHNYLKDPITYEDELFGMFDILITNILYSFGFTIEFDDAKQECFLLILKILKNFKHDRGSGFNYFTTVILNNLRLIYSKNKRYQEKTMEYVELEKEKYKPTT